MQRNRLFLIGLDAADSQVTERFMDEGDMPRLAAIRQTGCFSQLKSTTPPQTAPAWTSMTTGVNPGKHGIYYFYNFSTSPLTIINATHTSTPRIWDYVSSLDLRSVLVNVPVTYPAQQVRGSMVSGIPPWYFDAKSVFPASLYERLQRTGYEIETPMSRGLEKHPDALVDRLVATEEKRVELLLTLFAEGEWAFGMLVITALDRLQHKIVGKGEKEDKALRRCYGEVDRLVGKMIDSLGEKVNYIVGSDHGFNQRPLAFYPNAWLYRQGLLRRKSFLRDRLTKLGHDMFDGHLLWLPQGLTKRFQGAAKAINTIDAIDVANSRAFVPGTDGVLVAKSKRDQDAIISGLSGLKDDSGQEVCKVYRRDQVYSGDKLNDAPDLLIVPRDDINIRTDPFAGRMVSRSGNFTKGNHSSTGILLGCGPDIKVTRRSELSVEDVAPTCLVLLGIRPPETMDGRVVREMLSDQSPLETLQLVEVVADSRSHAFTEKEEKQVMDNLKRLGYT